MRVVLCRNKGKSSFDGMLSAMEAKYGAQPKSEAQEPSDEQFEAAAARLGKKKQAKQKENQAADGQQKQKKHKQK